MNLPNILTCLRFVLTLVFITFLFSSFPGAKFWALFSFSVASLTDLLDGYLARKYNQITFFGKLMDPIADKFLTLGAFFSLSFLGLVPMWAAIVIALRELLVTLMRFFIKAKADVSANKWGKLKTVLQCGYVLMALLYLVARETSFWQESWTRPSFMFLAILLALVLGVTLWSGALYAFSYLKKKK